jgi:fibro-slime domain-containing protein
MRFLSHSPIRLVVALGPLVLGFSIAGVGGCARVVAHDDGSVPIMVGKDSGTALDGSSRADRRPGTIPTVCGDGMRTTDEACDDGNTVSGDGCAADCKTVDPGYSCIPVGHPCHRIARCGDGVVVPPELCDDGNQAAGDGCSSTCKVEIGFKCSGNPSTCTHTTCGDRIIEGAESCDDGNATPFDGCSADCQSEPNCAAGACASRCGDGIVVGEACDDGNNLNGDGCTSDCKIEPGFECHQPPLGNKMLVPIVYRDFHPRNPTDFQPSALGQNSVVPGIVKPDLDADGKPVYAGGVANSFIASQATFSQWYRDTAGVNHPTASKLTLWSDGAGAYVNRWGANGEPWPLTTIAYFCGSVGQERIDPATGLPIPCTFQYGMADCDKDLALGYTMLQCIPPTSGADGGAASGSYTAIFQTGTVDGNPLFFPVDGDNFSPASERVSATYGPPYAENFTAEAGKPLHNFAFTSEVRYWFQYDAAQTYTLNFTGDDDVWVFINKKLAVDLGGIHVPKQGSVTFGARPAVQPVPPLVVVPGSTFGLTGGQVYEIAVFQAERQTDGSSYRLTLSGFSAAPSECLPICGDGILGIGEECDDGTNLGGYGQCGPGCKLGEFCGDGVVQPDFEDCDDGVNNGNPCPSGCKKLIIP